MDEAIKLSQLLIDHVSAVDNPAHLAPGWMVLKGAERSLTAALAPAQPRVRKSGIRIHWSPEHPDVWAAMTHENEDWVALLKRDGSRTTISKRQLDPAERAAEVSPSSTSALPAVKAVPRPAAQHANPAVRENVAALLAQLADALGVSLDELGGDTLRGDPSSVDKAHGFRFFTS